LKATAGAAGAGEAVRAQKDASITTESFRSSLTAGTPTAKQGWKHVNEGNNRNLKEENATKQKD
jgi:hypothetical protein